MGDELGLGLYAVPLGAFFVETFYGVFCWWIYKGRVSLLAVIIAFNLANFTFFSTAIVGPEALLANRPLLLTNIVLVQIILTLVLVGRFSRREVEQNTAGSKARSSQYNIYGKR